VRIGVQGGFDFLAGALFVVVAEEIFGGGDVGRPVAAVDHVVGADEDVEDGVVEGIVVLVGAGQGGPAVQGASDEGGVGGAGEGLYVAAPGIEKLLGRVDEPGEAALGGAEITGMIVDGREPEMGGDAVGRFGDGAVEKGDGLIEAAEAIEDLDALNGYADIAGDGWGG
jgi:hypothetical protein